MLGATFLTETSRGNTKHLWICVTDEHNGQVLIVNVTSDCNDPTTILQTGEHPFIQYPSQINYSQARIADAVAVRQILQSERRREPVADDVFRRVSKGVRKSPMTSKAVFNFYQDWIDTPPF